MSDTGKKHGEELDSVIVNAVKAAMQSTSTTKSTEHSSSPCSTSNSEKKPRKSSASTSVVTASGKSPSNALSFLSNLPSRDPQAFGSMGQFTGRSGFQQGTRRQNDDGPHHSGPRGLILTKDTTDPKPVQVVNEKPNLLIRTFYQDTEGRRNRNSRTRRNSSEMVKDSKKRGRDEDEEDKEAQSVPSEKRKA
eukprot:Clim_evm108s134 gene=Clim_evmTU108s134